MILVGTGFDPEKVAQSWRCEIDADRVVHLFVDTAGSYGFALRNGQRIRRLAVTADAAEAMLSVLMAAFDLAPSAQDRGNGA